jgi:hypothetical protein
LRRLGLRCCSSGKDLAADIRDGLRVRVRVRVRVESTLEVGLRKSG